jgi:3-deoxy-7-phosphoheptulonate synthase
LASIVELKEKTDLPVIYDPSHATGDAKYIKQFSQAAMALGADGLIIESHCNPEEAQSDVKQCIPPHQIGEIVDAVSNLHYALP